MARGRTQRVMSTQATAGQETNRPDDLIVEEPLEIRLDDQLVSTTMRTPGHDYELAAGFCMTEGLLGGATVTEIRYCATGSAVETEFNVVSVDTGGRAPTPTPRLGNTTSSCGLCGSASIDTLASRLAPLDPVRVDPAVVAKVGELVTDRQELFGRTGGVHAAATFDLDTGEIGVVREDIGRHNALDKVAGRLLLDGMLPASESGVWISGRASFEMVQKTWAIGAPVLVSVSAASALAVDTARRAGITLIAFARDDHLVRYP
ncbi:MAG TPA: formate dehydrogenase accessory sulfurtransferase FdhD [Microthrixaceae bacterium]|nr:formate dehydrogenase accessory sulfurtransferase FdhD [Microthrixaceae bacterium]